MSTVHTVAAEEHQSGFVPRNDAASDVCDDDTASVTSSQGDFDAWMAAHCALDDEHTSTSFSRCNSPPARPSPVAGLRSEICELVGSFVEMAGEERARSNVNATLAECCHKLASITGRALDARDEEHAQRESAQACIEAENSHLKRRVSQLDHSLHRMVLDCAAATAEATIARSQNSAL
ncbi:hypothetical protein IWQ56_001849, partial [Coemansia nantahalensis]